MKKRGRDDTKNMIGVAVAIQLILIISHLLFFEIDIKENRTAIMFCLIQGSFAFFIGSIYCDTPLKPVVTLKRFIFIALTALPISFMFWMVLTCAGFFCFGIGNFAAAEHYRDTGLSMIMWGLMIICHYGGAFLFLYSGRDP